MRVLNSNAIPTIALTVAGLVGGLTACGTNDNKKQSNNGDEQSVEVTEEEKAALEAEFQTIPAAAIVRVPVDADGNATGEPQMMTIGQADGLENLDAVAAAFDNGQAPQKMISGKDELNDDTSTQSWQAWNNYGNYNSYGKNTSYGNSYGSNSSYGGRNWNHSYWYNSYKPVLYSKGYGWNYGHYRPTYYSGRGYNYYCYRPYSYWK